MNPFKFVLIGSTDAHTGLGTAEEDNFWGKATKTEPSAERCKTGLIPELTEAATADRPSDVASPFGDRTEVVQWYEWEMAASGYAAIWARENTRASLFEAMQRRETDATTGPRMIVRFFAGFDFEEGDQATPDLARIGSAKGVPMGGDLTGGNRSGKKAAPTFLVAALRDPEGANLDRVQIVKGWIGRDGRAKKQVGTTVDVENAAFSNTIGAAVLTAYDTRFLEIEMSDEVPMTTQDRAYTSPIWYTP